MMPDKLERVFGRARLKMTTGEHVEVFREAVAAGERRRYTKRFLETGDADFRQWTQREWRILARLIGHGVRCVPDVVQFDGGAKGGLRQVQTYDAGITVDQWATLLPVARDGMAQRHIFEDCAHWWALAHQCLAALDEIHRLQLVHLDIKADNICIPFDPATFDPLVADATLHPAFGRLALIDFAFSVVSREPLASALPIGWQKDYDYQSPRLLRALEAGAAGDLGPTQELDWRCDLYSLAAMLRRYLPADEWARAAEARRGWTPRRYEAARALIYELREAHDREASQVAPHGALMKITSEQLEVPELAGSLTRGWTLAPYDDMADVSVLVTPLTRIAAPRPTVTPALSVAPTAITEVPAVFRSTRVRALPAPALAERALPVVTRRARATRTALAASLAVALIAGTIPLVVGDRLDALSDALRDRAEDLRAAFAEREPPHEQVASNAAEEAPASVPEPAPKGASEHEPLPSTESGLGSSDANAAPSAEPDASRSAEPEAPALGVRAPAVELPAPAVEPPKATVDPTPSAAAEHVQRNEVLTSPKSQRRATLERHPSLRAKQESAAPTPHPAANARLAVPAPRAVPAAPNVDLAAAAKATQALVAASIPSSRQTSVSAVPSAPAAAATPMAPAAASPSFESTNASSAAMSSATTSVAQPPSVTSAPAIAAAQPAEPRRPRLSPPAATAPAEPWRLALHDVMAALNLTQAQAAPVEERNVMSPPPSGSSSSHSASSRQTPSPVPQAIAVTRPTVNNDDPELLLYQARGLLRSELPRIAAQAQNDIAPVLWTAAGADAPAQDRAVVNAALARWESERMHVTSSSTSERARELHQNAKRAFALGHDRDALEQALRAFAANPRDPEVAGFLAHLHLRVQPMQPEIARQLALYALALSGSGRRVRYDDWNTFAVASALTGRDSDASRALLAELALTTDVDRSCRAALGAYSMFGERLRAPVQGLMYRVRAQGRDRDSSSCRWDGTRAATRYAAGDGARF